MAGNSYPYIIFAKDAEVLPQQVLADLLTGMFPGVEVERGEIKAVLRLPDYAYTFWYDDDAEGLGDRYADFAAPLRRKRVTRCTTMIDASGEADTDGRHAEDVARVMAALAEREGVYVFSEETKRFLAMDYGDEAAASTAGVSAGATAATGATAYADDDQVGTAARHGDPAEAGVGGGAGAEDTMIAEISATTDTAEQEFVSPLEGNREPEADLQSTASYAPHADPAHSEVVLEDDEQSGDFPHTEEHPVDRPTAEHAPDEDRAVRAPEAATQATSADRPAEPSEQPAPATPTAPAAAGAPVEPSRGDAEKHEEKPGLLKRLFGRKR
ncbi:hypothetical protein [Mobilicoccus massiliensis]|uniref:hypothetical protein n=1 Tax=Mobilicoccus massiliensis TaxID=1522310 RepID=UPI00058E5A97|nr:hypothetical protein [Mobilicoccus massiliensis]